MLKISSQFIALTAPRVRFSFSGHAFLAGVALVATALGFLLIWDYYQEWRLQRGFRRFWKGKVLRPASKAASHVNPNRLTAIQMDRRAGGKRKANAAVRLKPVPAPQPRTSEPEIMTVPANSSLVEK